MEPTLLIVEDEPGSLSSLEKIFQREGFKVLTAQDGEKALEIFRQEQANVVLTDLMMPKMSGTTLLKTIKKLSPETEVVFMTAYGTVEIAVSAMKEGAYDFVEKPLKRHNIVKTVKKALEKHLLTTENLSLRQQIRNYQSKPIIGSSPALKKTLDIALQCAPSTATVLILGESGTGKELLAQFIHNHSPRSLKSFVAVNCSAIPETLLEAELFGYEKGAFTGAITKKHGRFLQAHQGTLFLDEIGETSPKVQVKLLRTLETGEIEPLGGKPIKVDLRLITATNQDLAQKVKENKFREDLYYRLNVISITLPPLRARRDDIPLLASHFLKIYTKKNKRNIQTISKQAMEYLYNYSWPGNVRELENTIERAVILSKGDTITEDLLPSEILKYNPKQDITISIGTSLEEIKQKVIKETLIKTRGDKKLAAKLLGIATRTIYRTLEKEKNGTNY